MATETMVASVGEANRPERVVHKLGNPRDLPVPDLEVTGFRGIESLRVPHFAQVTLVAGANGVGKTTLLEALKAFSAKGSRGIMTDILRSRRELIFTVNEDGDPMIELDWVSLFYGREASLHRTISLKSVVRAESLEISVASPEQIEEDNAEMHFGPFPPNTNVFRVESNRARRYVPWSREARVPRYRRRQAPYETKFPAETAMESIGPDVVVDEQLAEMWDDLIDSGGSKLEVVRSLSIMYGDRVRDIDMVGDSIGIGYGRGRRAKAHLDDFEKPVPLKSLGDGAMRIAGHILSVARPNTPLAVADEIENGIHHSIMVKFWRVMIDIAGRNNTQLVATTHSWDCVAAFASAAIDNEEVDCAMIRLDEVGGDILPTMYTEGELLSATEYGTEVR